MLKRVVVSVVVALLVSSSGLASISQAQGFSIGNTNLIQLTQGQQNGQSVQDLIVELNQEGTGTGLTVASAYLFSFGGQVGTGQVGTGLVGTGLVGTGLLGARQIVAPPVLGVSGVGLPLVAGAGANALLMRARLNSLLLSAY